MHGNENIMVILSSPSGVGKKPHLQKKYNKNTNLLKYQFHILRGQQDQTKLMVLIITLFQMKNLQNL